MYCELKLLHMVFKYMISHGYYPFLENLSNSTKLQNYCQEIFRKVFDTDNENSLLSKNNADKGIALTDNG